MLIKQAALRGFFRFLWEVVKMRDWLLNNTTKLIKWITPFMLFATVLMFYLNKMGVLWLPDFVQLNPLHTKWIMWVLLGQGGIHLFLLLHQANHLNLKVAVWHAWLLFLSGFSLAVVGWGFIAHYPPFHWLMVFFPVLGVLIAFAGLSINNRAIFELEQKNKKKKGKNAC